MNLNQKRIEKQVLTACEEMNCRLYILEQNPKRLKIYVDPLKGGSMNISEYEKVAKRILFFLKEDNLLNNMELEVSSPGLNKKLKYPWHFKEVLGQKIKILLKTPVERKKTFLGFLRQVNENSIQIECEQIMTTLDFECIKQAHLFCDPFGKK